MTIKCNLRRQHVKNQKSVHCTEFGLECLTFVAENQYRSFHRYIARFYSRCQWHAVFYLQSPPTHFPNYRPGTAASFYAAILKVSYKSVINYLCLYAGLFIHFFSRCITASVFILQILLPSAVHLLFSLPFNIPLFQNQCFLFSVFTELWHILHLLFPSLFISV